VLSNKFILEIPVDNLEIPVDNFKIPVDNYVDNLWITLNVATFIELSTSYPHIPVDNFCCKCFNNNVKKSYPHIHTLIVINIFINTLNINNNKDRAILGQF